MSHEQYKSVFKICCKTKIDQLKCKFNDKISTEDRIDLQRNLWDQNDSVEIFIMFNMIIKCKITEVLPDPNDKTSNVLYINFI